MSEGTLTRFTTASPEGNHVYFTSNRDSYWCIWGRRTDPDSGSPIGEIFSVYHSHGFRSGIAGSWDARLALAADKLAFDWAEDHGNIWMVEGVELD